MRKVCSSRRPERSRTSSRVGLADQRHVDGAQVSETSRLTRPYIVWDAKKSFHSARQGAEPVEWSSNTAREFVRVLKKHVLLLWVVRLAAILSSRYSVRT